MLLQHNWVQMLLLSRACSSSYTCRIPSSNSSHGSNSSSCTH
jgi:hypothetical protein